MTLIHPWVSLSTNTGFTNYFEGIASNANSTLSNLGPNKWGYSTYDATNEVRSNYNGLATVGSAGTTLISASTPGTKSIDMKIGASASFNTGDSVQLSSTIPSASNAISFLGWCDGTVSGQTKCTFWSANAYQSGIRYVASYNIMQVTVNTSGNGNTTKSTGAFVRCVLDSQS